jgi:hypothetical protein
MLDLAARTSTGREMPDGTPGIGGSVLTIQTEDSLEKTVLMRAEAAGADLRRIGMMQDVSLPADIGTIESAIVKLQARLVILDPIMWFLKNASGEQAVREGLTPLREVAERQNAAVVIVRHLRKNGGGNALYRGMGSIAITAIARSQLLLGGAPQDSHLSVLAQAKSNLGPKSPSLLFEAGNDGRIAWHGECDCTADELSATPKNERPAMEIAKDILLEALAHGEVEATHIEHVAAGRVSLRTLERAKQELGIVSRREGFGPGSKVFWALTDRPEEEATP